MGDSTGQKGNFLKKLSKFPKLIKRNSTNVPVCTFQSYIGPPERPPPPNFSTPSRRGPDRPPAPNLPYNLTSFFPLPYPTRDIGPSLNGHSNSSNGHHDGRIGWRPAIASSSGSRVTSTSHSVACHGCNQEIIGRFYKAIIGEVLDLCENCFKEIGSVENGILVVPSVNVLSNSNISNQLLVTLITRLIENHHHEIKYCCSCSATINDYIFICIECPEFQLCCSCERQGNKKSHQGHVFVGLVSRTSKNPEADKLINEILDDKANSSEDSNPKKPESRKTKVAKMAGRMIFGIGVEKALTWAIGLALGLPIIEIGNDFMSF